jgi:uncharacterized UPF0146 family protein
MLVVDLQKRQAQNGIRMEDVHRPRRSHVYKPFFAIYNFNSYL